MIRHLALLLGMALAACGGSAGPGSAQPEPEVPFGKLAGQPDATRWLGPDAQKAQAAGAGDTEIVAVSAGAPGDRVTGMLSLPAKDCALIIARAADSVEDVDLFAYGDDGSVLGSDEAPDRTPSVLVCPPHPTRLFVVARVAAGHGIVAVGAQRVSEAHARKVGKALDARGRPGEEQGRADDWQGLDDALAEHRRRIGGRWLDVRRTALPIDPRMPTRLSALVDANRCLSVLVLPSDEVSHLDVAALDVEGRIIGRAAASGRERSLVICSPERAAITIQVRPHSGRGLAAVALSRSEDSDTSDIVAPKLRYDLAPLGSLQAVRDTLADRLGAAGHGHPKVVGKGLLEVGRRHSVSLDLPPGCSRLDVLAGEPVRGVEAWLWDENGELLANARGPWPTLFACNGGKARIDLEALTRPGRFVVELRAEPGAPKALLAHPLAAGRLLSRMISRNVIRRASQVGAPTVVRVGPATLVPKEILVPVGRCVDVTLALGPGAVGAEVRLLDAASGDELGLARGTHSTSARACAVGRPRTLNVRAELRAAAGEADALVATRMLAPKP